MSDHKDASDPKNGTPLKSIVRSELSMVAQKWGRFECWRLEKARLICVTVDTEWKK